ncbi:MAG: hypothetical protein M4D80_03710 [Myxococcota bacterium]|nr:hypothetical protein [Deltaproteobacteria bacterium]MDQ3334242.1 hypothetical protein [Myxococcota bacterium]
MHPSWPLTEPPSLEPHLRVASPWYVACERRGRLQDDVLAYVEVWCRFRVEPSFDLVRALAPLQRSTAPGLAAAVRLDLANQLAEMPAPAALAWLESRRDPGLYSVLAALYIDLGKLDDAEQVSQRIRAHHARTTCEHDLVELRFFDEPADLQALVNRHLTESCESEVRRIVCVIELGSERAGIARDHDLVCPDHILDDDTRMFTAAYAAWHLFTTPNPRVGTFEIADLAISALAVPDAEEIALRTLSALAPLTCSSPRAADLLRRVQTITDSPHAQSRHADRRAQLAKRCSRR